MSKDKTESRGYYEAPTALKYMEECRAYRSITIDTYLRAKDIGGEAYTLIAGP
jgi:hypothetical protein